MSCGYEKWFDTPGLPKVAFAYTVKTGKMLQRVPAGPGDAEVPYLKAMHVQQDSIVDLDDLPTMWASAGDATAVGVRPGDLLVCEGGQIGRSAVVSPHVPADAVIEKSLHRVRTEQNSLRYLHYLLEVLRASGWFEAKSGVTTLSHLTGESLRELRLPIPTVEMQQAITDYLDRETERIEALIDAKQHMVALLSDRARALATDVLLGQSVWGGSAGPDQVTLRPSWRFVPFRRLFREIDERSVTGAETLLSVSQTRGVIPQSELGDRQQFAETHVGYKLCRPGDLVVNWMWVYYGALGPAQEPGMVSPDYAVFRPSAGMSARFAAYVLRTPAYVAEMTRLVRGIGAAFQGSVRKPRLHPNEMGLIEMPVPPIAEQRELLARLDEQTRSMAHHASLVQRSIALLQERRRALITAAVTGNLQITVAA